MQCSCSTTVGTSCASKIFANQKRLGVIPEDTRLVPWPRDVLKEWNQCTADEKKLFIRQAEVFAAYAAYSDHEIGRVIQAVEDIGKLDNTLIIYINGDNGTSAEGGPMGTPNEVAFFNGVNKMPVDVQMNGMTSGARSRPTITCRPAGRGPSTRRSPGSSRTPRGSAASNQNMAVSWPARIKDKGGLRQQFVHVIDVVPTILEAAGIRAPEFVDGIKQAPIEGTSFAYTFDAENAKAPSRHKTQYFEMMGQWALYDEGWFLSTKVNRAPWEAFGAANPDPLNNQVLQLYDLNKDFSQTDDLAAKNPQKVKEMKQKFIAEAKKYQVFPMDASVAARIVAPRPNITAGRTEFVYTRPMVGLPQGDSPLLLNALVHDHCRHRGAAGRRRRHDPDLRRALRRLRLLLAQGEAGVPLEPGRPRAHQVGRTGASPPGRHTVEFDSSTTESAQAHSRSTTSAASAGPARARSRSMATRSPPSGWNARCR